MHKSLIKFLPLVVAGAMTGCASMQMPVQNATADGIHAKTQVAKAVRSQLRTSFGYQTNVYASDVNMPSKNQDCTKAHMSDYLSINQDQSISDQERETKVHAINQTYEQCLQAEIAMLSAMQAVEQAATAATVDSGDVAFDDTDASDGDDALNVSADDAVANGLDAEVWREGVWDEDNAQPSPADKHKMALFDRYVVKPTQVQITGKYQPLHAITAVPSLSYHAKNARLSVSQPIYIDVKAGVIYLWADNIARMNNEHYDRTLGLQWQNKWLAIPLNDGSLPKGFAQDFIKAYLKAKKDSFESLPNASFNVISATAFFELPDIEQVLPKQTQELIHGTDTIIRLHSTHADDAYAKFIFWDSFYQEMIAKYPELTESPTFADRVIGDDEGNVLVEVSTVNAGDANDAQAKSAPKLDSKNAMKGLFTLVGVASHVNSQKVSEQAKSVELTPSVSHFGLNNGKLSWIHQRSSVGSPYRAAATVDSFTQIQKLSDEHEFVRLPKEHREPNAQNTVDFWEYGISSITEGKNKLSIPSAGQSFEQLLPLLQMLGGDETQ